MLRSGLKSFPTLLLLLLTAGVAGAQTISARAIKLDDNWQFLPDRSGALKVADLGRAEGWRGARVGLSWNAQFEDLRDYMGVAWYRTRFEAPDLAGSRRALVRFQAVDYFSEVFVNGKQVGVHEGGYTPFVFDITDALRRGANELVVRVIDPMMDEKENRARFPEMMYNEIPHGKQNWYVQTGGIWQPVWLETRPALYLKDVRVTAKIDGSVSVRLETNQALAAAARAAVRVLDPSGKAFALKRTGGGPSHAVYETKIANPRLWSTDEPNLYTVEADVGGDRLTDRFGFRSFEARDGKLYLNGEPYYMIAALDQDFYPETIYTPPSEEYVRDQMLKGKRLGLNMLRCHIKVPDPVYLKVADEVGMLVWYEVPSWNDFNHFSPRAAERGEKVFAEMVARDWNHPSIVIMSIINEGWGTNLKQEEQRRWLRAAFGRAKQLVEPRGLLVVDNSACCDNFHIKSDIEDNHRYNSIPDYSEPFDRWVADFAARPKWNFSPHGDAEPSGREPLIVSEFGNWGLPRLPEKLPWWFDRVFAGREVTRPAGVLDRFKQFQLDRLFGSFDALADETQWHQFLSLKHEIEQIRRHASIQGYVITEFTDINWEVNGLMDMWRNPKVYAAELAKLQKPDLIIARSPRRNYTSGERVEIETLVSHYSDKDLTGARLTWTTASGERGQLDIPRAINRAGVERLAPLSFVSPKVDRLLRERVSLEARARDGSVVAQNSYDVFVFPKPEPAKATPLIFSDPLGGYPRLGQSLAAAGYNLAASEGDGKAIMLATAWDDRVKRHLEGGGRAVLLIDSKEALPAGRALKVAPRAGSDLDGNWVTNFNWVRPDRAPFGDVAAGKLLGFEAASTIPQYVIQGVEGANYEDVLAGIFYGWLNNNAALAVQGRAGGGKVLATTFRFGEYGNDPYATHLLDAIIRYAGGAAFEPNLDWK